ncbi:MAG: transposase [Rhodanobacter sp.]|nr:MAG: transposase [Rhodanobacter sp.]
MFGTSRHDDGLAMPLHEQGVALPNHTEAHWRVQAGIRRRGTDERILSLHLRGFSLPAIQQRLKVAHDVDVPLSYLASVVHAPTHEVTVWRTRPLDANYPVMCLASHQLKSGPCDEAPEIVCVAMGITMAGEKEVLGFWLTSKPDTAFRCRVLRDLRNRGVKNVLIVCTGEPVDFGHAVHTVFPRTRVLPVIGKVVTDMLEGVPEAQRAEVGAALKRIYRSVGIEETERHRREFETRWGSANFALSQLAVFLDYPAEVRKVVVTACGVMEAMISSFGKVRRRLEFHADGTSTTQLIYLAIAGTCSGWKMPVKRWKPALKQLRSRFGHRLS